MEPDERFAPEAARFHLQLSGACPWAHRTRIHRALLGLEDVISFSIVGPLMGDDGWVFTSNAGALGDPIHNASFLRDVHVAARSDYIGRVTVPILLDRAESSNTRISAVAARGPRHSRCRCERQHGPQNPPPLLEPRAN